MRRAKDARERIREALNKSTFVIPAEAGIQLNQASGPRLSPGWRLVQGLIL